MPLSLTQYLARTNQLLQSPSASNALYATEDVTSWINRARVWVAAEGECVRNLGTVTTAAGTRKYNLVDIDTGADTGIEGVLKINSIMYVVAEGGLWIAPQSWPLFQTTYLAKVVPQTGAPQDWALFGQGNVGNFYLDPIPDVEYELTLDCICYPSDLTGAVDEVDPIPTLWDDCVPYFAAYLALLSAQTGQRQADADRMYNRYQTFVGMARQFSNPQQSGYLYSQSKDPARANKLATGGRLTE